METTTDTEKIKNSSLIVVCLIILAFDWAALHDIINGESNLYAEYALLACSGLVFTLLLFVKFSKKIET